jgi:transcriptional regulator with XRE-family HTH domain
MDLRTYLDRHTQSLPAFADRLGISNQALHRYLNGERLPRPEIMERIARETGGQVRVQDFYPFMREWPDCCSYGAAE